MKKMSDVLLGTTNSATATTAVATTTGDGLEGTTSAAGRGGGIGRMNASGNTRKRSRSVVMAILFLPSWPQRLTFLGVFVFVAVTVIAPSYAPYAWGTIVLLFLVAAGFTVRDSRRKTGYWVDVIRVLDAMVSVVIIGVAVILATRFVATGGTIGVTSHHTTRFQYVAFDLIVITLGLLLWVPHLFFAIQLDRDGTGDAQRVLLGPIAATASVLTGIYILVEHFSGGPLRGISTGPLVAGVIGLVVIVTPAYRSLVRGCWRNGICGILQLSEQRQDWAKALTELGAALDRARAIAPVRVAARTTAKQERTPSVVLILGALLGCSPWIVALGAWGAYGNSGYTIYGQRASTSAVHSLCQGWTSCGADGNLRKHR
jgi:hypothetical protein